jgi:hypothetical protein
VPLAKSFSRSDEQERPKALEVDPGLIKKLVQGAADLIGLALTDELEKWRFEYKLNCTIQAYYARILAGQQERPAQIVAALEPVHKRAESLLRQLNSLPRWVRFDLRAGGIERSLHELGVLTEALIYQTKNRVTYWQGRVEAHRPTGERVVSLDLRISLTEIITEHWADPPDATHRQKRANERKRRRWVAFACNKIGARNLHEKKHRRRFTGERPSNSKEPKNTKRHGAGKHRRIRQSRAERRLKGVLI